MSESMSESVTGVAPSLVGVWTFDPADPGGTSRQFLFAQDRKESIEVDSTRLQFVGRRRPVFEHGEAIDGNLGLTVFLPFGDDHDSGVIYWRDAVLAGRSICYRDNRGRLEWVALADGITLADAREGTGVGVSLVVVDYDEAVV